MSPPEIKPYRRFRAHGRGQDAPADELAALRELNSAEPKGKAGRQRERVPVPPRQPASAPPSRRRRWWSLRGVGPGGLAARFAGLVTVAVLVWVGLGYLALRSAASDANSRISQTARNALSDPGGGLLGTPENILVIGSDADRDRSGARADTILVMRTDPDAGRIKYLSVPRDLRVEIPGVGDRKIGEAFAYRGNRGVIQAIRNTIGIPIHHIVVLDFRGVAKMVEAVGGVELDNPYDLQGCSYPGGRSVSFPKGSISLDGDEALVYSRVRSCDNDIERARRQQLVVSALQRKLLSWTSLPSAPWRGAKMIRAMSTDMSAADLAKLGWLQARLTSEPGDRQVLAGTPTRIGGVFYFLFDPNEAEEQIRRFQGGR